MPSATSEVGLRPHNVIIRAGAGSGKTTELVRRVREIHQYFWSHEGRHPKIIISTFTRKATQELSERLLASAMASNFAPFTDFVNRPSLLHISTLHGVYSHFLARFGHEIEIAPQFEMISERQNRRLQKKVFRDLLLSSEDFKAWATDILEIVDLKELLKSLAQGFPQALLGRSRLISEAELRAKRDARAMEFHRSVAGLLAEWRQTDPIQFTGKTPGKNAEKWRHLSEVLARLGPERTLADWSAAFEGFEFPPRNSKFPPALTAAYDHFRTQLEDLQSPEMQDSAIAAHEVAGQKFARLLEVWTKAVFEEKRLHSLLSFEDLELFSLKLCLSSPSSAKSFSQEWDYWMLDEYQDTSPLQVEILKHLVGERPAFIVGDPQQSIYLFRNARYEVFTQKEEEFRDARAELLTMNLNYRSDPGIVHEINRLFPALDKKQFTEMEPARAARPANIRLQSVRSFEIADSPEADESSEVASEIRNMIARGLPPGEIVVLAKSHRQLEDIAQKSLEMGVPIQLSDSGLLSRKQEVIDTLSILRFLLMPQDNVNFLRLLRSPFFKVEDAILTRLKGSGDESYYQRALGLNLPAVSRLETYLDMAKTLGVTFVWQNILLEAGVFHHYAELDPTFRAEANIWHLIAGLRSQLRDGDLNILNWIEEISNEEFEESIPRVESPRVRLMTIHASKGLQFPHVLIPFLGQKPVGGKTQFFMQTDAGVWTLSLPSAEDGSKKKSLLGAEILEEQARRQSDESLRLLYVAMTRAQESVTLFWSKIQKNSFAESLQRVGLSPQAVDPPADEGIRPSPTSERRSIRAPFRNLAIPLESGNLSVTSQLKDPLHPAGNGGPSGPSRPAVVPRLESVNAVLYGIQVHKALENLRYRPETIADTEATAFLKSWREGILWRLAREGHAEWGFVYMDPKTELKVSGQIDLWGELEDRVLVVDYKTGSERGKEKAFQQLRAYAKALRQMRMVTPSKDIELLVVFTTSQKVDSEIIPGMAVSKNP